MDSVPTESSKTIAEHIYTSFTTPWPYVTLSVLTTIFIFVLARILWHKFKRTHKTTLHFELTTGSDCILIKLAELPLCPDNWDITPPHEIHNLIITRSCFFWATLTIHSSELEITNVHTNQPMHIPNTVSISPFKAYKLRNLMRQPYAAYFLLSHHQYFKLLR